MSGEQTLAESEGAETSPPEVPFLFGCALWVPVFAVLLYFFMWFLRPRPVYGVAPEETPLDDD